MGDGAYLLLFASKKETASTSLRARRERRRRNKKRWKATTQDCASHPALQQQGRNHKTNTKGRYGPTLQSNKERKKKSPSLLTSSSPVSHLRRIPAIGLAPTTSCPICRRTRGSGFRVRVPTTNSLASEFVDKAAIRGGFSPSMDPTTARQSVITWILAFWRRPMGRGST